MQTETRATNKITKSKIVDQTGGSGFSSFAGTRSLKTATVEVADKAFSINKQSLTQPITTL